MKIFLTYLLSIISFLFVQGQNISLSGQISDKDGHAIPIATISLQSNQVATSSDFEGNFKLVFPKSSLPDTITIRHLSFDSKTFFIDSENIKDFIRIILKTKENEIGEAAVFASSATKIIEKVIQKIPENYDLGSYYVSGFYRQAHKENNKYVRLIECFADVLETAENRNSTKQKESFRIKDIRRSNVYERNGDQHGDHLVDLFSEDPIIYAYSSFLNEQAYRKYNFSFEENSKSDLLKISFQNKSWTETQNKSGYVLINRSDYAITEIKIISTQNPLDKSYNKSDWRFQNGTYKIQYRKQNGKYYCNRSSKYYNHYVLNEFTKNVEYIVEEYFDWWRHEIVYGSLDENLNLTFNDTLYTVYQNGTGYYTHEKINFKSLTNLYSVFYKYTGGWDNWTPPISQKIIDDLNSFMDLEKQFVDD